jgi:hypothetical protein
MKYAIVISLIFLSSCSLFQTDEKDAEPEYTVNIYDIPISKNKAVDMLFVIDNSLGLAENQTLLKAQFVELLRRLKDTYGGLPDLHIGVTSTDLGTSPYNIPSCDTRYGDNGKLLKGSCTNPQNNNYIVDVEPAGCNIERNDSDNHLLCTSSDCAADNCLPEAFTINGVATEPADLIFVEHDENNCPRCRNYSNEDIGNIFACIADLGVRGCGFEQPLESMYRVFTHPHIENKGFLRDDAYLSILFLTDEDDCSAKDYEIFNPVGDINSSLGGLTSFRCTEFGIRCDEEWNRDIYGIETYTNCTSRPSDDPDAMLHPISKYINLLAEIKGSSNVITTAIAGPYDGTLLVGKDENSNPKLGFSCGESHPAVRIKEFISAFTPASDDMEWAYLSNCSNDYSPLLIGLGEKIRSVLAISCITAPIVGCPDPSFFSGYDKITNLPDMQAEVCIPECSIVEKTSEGVEEQIEQCPSSYLNGHPLEIDPQLPLEKCFHIKFNERCAQYDNHGPSRGATIEISRQQTPQLGTKVTATCKSFTLTEENCHNNIDDDFDGDIDTNDMDCQL